MIRLVGVLLIAFSSASAAGAADFAATIDGEQAASSCKGSGSQGSGTFALDAENAFSWHITFGSNSPTYDDGQLDGDETFAHVHGPAPPGETEGVLITFELGSPKTGSVDIDTIPEAHASDLESGLWYVNIHSRACPQGEIRGQILPEPGMAVPLLPGPAWLVLACAGALLALAWLARSRRHRPAG